MEFENIGKKLENLNSQEKDDLILTFIELIKVYQKIEENYRRQVEILSGGKYGNRTTT